MSVVLVVEPDTAQASLLKKMQKRLKAELVLVKSTEDAIDVIERGIPDLILLSTLLSPRDEDRLMTYLRSLDGASHLQTLTIPQMSGDSGSDTGGKKGFSFRKKRGTPAPSGCDPVIFAQEISAQLTRAAEVRSRPPSTMWPIIINVAIPAESAPEPQGIFEDFVAMDDPSATDDLVAFHEPAAIEEPIFAALEVETPTFEVETPTFEAQIPIFEAQTPVFYEPLAVEPEPIALEPIEPEPVVVERATAFELSIFDKPVIKTPDSFDEELERLARELGVSFDVGMAEVQDDDSAERMAAEVALVQAEAEARLATEIERVRLEAEGCRLTELARLQADADAMREAAIAEARASAELETRLALATEVARVRSEAEGTFAEAVNKVKVEAEQTLSQEIGRARVDAEALRADLVRVQGQAAETARALETEVTRVRAQAEGHLKAELERIRKDAERARVADQSHAKATAEEIREAATREARAIAEESARRTLQVEVARVRSQADTILATEIARVRAEAQERQEAELLEIRAQMAEIRETAADQVREAAEQARAAAAAAVRRPAEVISFPVVDAPQARRDYQTECIEEIEQAAEETQRSSDTGERFDYYSLWKEVAPVQGAGEEDSGGRNSSDSHNYTRWIKWGLPVAASLVLVVVSGIDTVARLNSPSTEPNIQLPHSRVVTEIPERETVTPVETRLGSLRVESAPSGAQIMLDGESRGVTPQTIPDLKPGTHMLVLKSEGGSLVRQVTIRAGHLAVASEAIFAGWLAIFSPIPLTVSLNGTVTAPTEEGRIMVAPGTYQVEMVNSRFNVKRTETLVVKPGQVTAHTVSLPTGTLKISAPDGTAIGVDGQAIGKAPFPEHLPLVVGTHEVTAAHPDLGSRRATVDVRFEETTETTFNFEP